MTKQELKDKITAIAQRVLSDEFSKTDDILQTQDVEIEVETYPLLTQFPSLKEVIVKLLTKQYKSFIKDIWWVAPRPTTFRIVLANGENFILIYTERSWIAKVEGKKYYLLNLSEEEAAAESIARILSYGLKEENQTPDELSGEEPAEVKPEDIKPEENNPQPEEIPAEA